jgi:hypothetical protein
VVRLAGCVLDDRRIELSVPDRVLDRDPSEDAHLSPVERDYILAGGAVPEGRADGGTAQMLGYILTRRKVWGLTLGFACYGYSNSCLLRGCRPISCRP